MRTHYVALEGIEGAGKSSLVHRVAAGLEAAGHPSIVVREPGGTQTGERIRSILLESEEFLSPWAEALLFAAQRAQLATQVIGPALLEGTSVVSDRSVYSSLSYQGAGRGLGIEPVKMVNRAGLGEVWPTIVVLLSVDPQVGLARQATADRIGSEGIDFQQRVADAYARLAAEEPERFVVVEASGSGVADRVVAEVLARW